MTTTTDTPTLDQVLAIAVRLSRSDRTALITTLVHALAAEVPVAAPAHDSTLSLPVITEGTWSDAIPMRREELYDDCGR